MKPLWYNRLQLLTNLDYPRRLEIRMRSHTEYLTLNIPSKMAFVNITPQVEEAVRKSGVREGLVLVKASRVSSIVFQNPPFSKLLATVRLQQVRKSAGDACGG